MGEKATCGLGNHRVEKVSPEVCHQQPHAHLHLFWHVATNTGELRSTPQTATDADVLQQCQEWQTPSEPCLMMLV